MFKNKLLLIIIAIIMSISCTRMSSINMKPHSFNEKPQKIIWIQVAGLSEEHLAMLRYDDLKSNQPTSIGASSCVGKMWNYNLYDLRPTAFQGFFSQIAGLKNVKGTCEDYKHKPIWEYLESIGFSTGILEGPSKKNETLTNMWQCGKEATHFYNNLTFWKMGKAPTGSQTFHYQEKNEFDKKGLFYDKSCQRNLCYASLFGNVKSVFERFKKRKRDLLFIVRDFSYLDALQRKKIFQAKEILAEIEKIYEYFAKYAENQSETLILLSSAGVKNIEFPKAGKNWATYNKTGKHVLFKRRALLSTVFAKGPGAENFCGMFEEAEFLKRVLWAPKKSRIRIDFL